MKFFNDEDRDTSICVHTFIRGMVADDMKSAFMAGTYACVWDDGKTATLNGFLDSKILESNLIPAVANHELNHTPRLLIQEVSHFYNERHIATRLMQSFVFSSRDRV